MSHQTPAVTFFQSEVEKQFSFLTDEFGFRRVNDHSIELRAMFQNDELDLWIGNDKGTYDAIFWLKKNVSWLRPYESRMFPLYDLLKLLAPEEIQSLRNTLHGQGVSPESECHAVLQFYARSLKHYCAPLLQGHYQVLEQVYARRVNLQQ